MDRFLIPTHFPPAPGRMISGNTLTSMVSSTMETSTPSPHPGSAAQSPALSADMTPRAPLASTQASSVPQIENEEGRSRKKQFHKGKWKSEAKVDEQKKREDRHEQHGQSDFQFQRSEDSHPGKSRFRIYLTHMFTGQPVVHDFWADTSQPLYPQNDNMLSSPDAVRGIAPQLYNVAMWIEKCVMAVKGAEQLSFLVEVSTEEKSTCTEPIKGTLVDTSFRFSTKGKAIVLSIIDTSKKVPIATNTLALADLSGKGKQVKVLHCFDQSETKFADLSVTIEVDLMKGGYAQPSPRPISAQLHGSQTPGFTSSGISVHGDINKVYEYFTRAEDVDALCINEREKGSGPKARAHGHGALGGSRSGAREKLPPPE